MGTTDKSWLWKSRGKQTSAKGSCQLPGHFLTESEETHRRRACRAPVHYASLCFPVWGLCDKFGGKLGTGADAGLSSLAHEHSFHFHVYLNTATCKAVIHHPSIRQYLGDSDSQFSLLSPATATHPSIHISSSQLEM